jgi:hypothetical protein
MKKFPRTVVFATVMALIAFPAFAIFGVLYLAEGDILRGCLLLACFVAGVPRLSSLAARVSLAVSLAPPRAPAEPRG